MVSAVQYIILFMASQFALAAVFLPWSSLKEPVEIYEGCILPTDYQFRQWGGACKENWSELKERHFSGYFAMLHSMTKIRVFSIICVILLNLCIGCPFKENIRKTQVITVHSITVFILSMMATSMYFTDQNTTMVIPIRLLQLQGPGFWAQVVTASLSLANVFIEFYNTYRL